MSSGVAATPENLDRLESAGFRIWFHPDGTITAERPHALDRPIGGRVESRLAKQKLKKEQRAASISPYVSKRGDKRIAPVYSRCAQRDEALPARRSKFRCGGDCELCALLDDPEERAAMMTELGPEKAKWIVCSRVRNAIYADAAGRVAAAIESIERKHAANPDRLSRSNAVYEDKKLIPAKLRLWELHLGGMFNSKNLGREGRGDAYSSRFRFVEKWMARA